MKFVAAAALVIGLLVPAMATDRIIGDSTGLGIGASNPPTTGYVPLVAAALGTTFDNRSISGGMVPNAIYDAFTNLQTAPTAADRIVIDLGINDQRIYGVDSYKQGVFQSGLMSLVGWFALGNKVLANQTGGETGSWGAGYYSFGRHANAVGSAKTFTVSGTSVYLSMLCADSSTYPQPGAYTVAVDGVVQETGQTAAPGITTIDAPPGHTDPFPYSERFYRYAGLAPGQHTVTVTQTQAGDIYVNWAAGSDQTIKPNVYLANVIRANSYQYGGSDANVSSYDTSVSAVAIAWAADGLNVHPVDICSVVDPTTDVNTGDVHPNDSGYSKIASAIQSAMGIAPPQYTFAACQTYQRSDGTFWIGSGAPQKQLSTQP